jgi:hypothetical protein
MDPNVNIKNYDRQGLFKKPTFVSVDNRRI